MLFWKCGVLIFSGEAETRGPYRVEYVSLFPYFLYYHKTWDTVS